MPLNDFSVGRDVTISIDTSTGPVVLSLITGFESHQQVVKKRVKGLDGINRPVTFPDGWTGKIDVEREDATLDKYFAQQEANYYAGQDNPTITITETITEVDGSVSQFQYQGVVLSLADGGSWKGDDTVKQTVDFEATKRIQLS